MHSKDRLKGTIAATSFVVCVLCTIALAYENHQSTDRQQSRFSPTVHAQGTKQNGLSYIEYAIEEYHPAIMNRVLTELQGTGANWVALVVTNYQYTPDSTAIYPTVKTATDSDLIYAIERAHELGLQVTLKPHVDIESDNSPWRGTIGQTFDESQWVPWFTAYQQFIDHYASIAQAHNVEQFVVGTELASTSQRTAEWRAIIQSVRAIYTDGLLTYSANHSGEETDIDWWDAVDHIGISAYYPIATNSNASLSELESGWRAQVSRLGDLSAATGKTILFTEVGFRSSDGAAEKPWCHDCAASNDLREQADAYQAFYNVIYNQPWFAGMYWWGWDVDPAGSGPCDTTYSPYNKPAENVVRQAHGIELKTLPSDCENIPPTATSIAITPTGTPTPPSTTTSAGFVLVDNFDAYEPGVVTGQNGWITLGNASATTDPVDAGNQALTLQGENVIAHYPLPFSIADGSVATIHYRMLRDGPVDGASGASEETFPTTFDAFEPQFGVQLKQADAFRARDEDEFKTLSGTFAQDSWYCVWIVTDMANIESEIYVKGGALAEITQLDSAGQLTFQFRNGDADLLRTFYTRTGWDGGGAIYIDDIYVDTTGKNLVSPHSACQSLTAVETPTPEATSIPPTATTEATAVPPTATPEATPMPEGEKEQVYLPLVEKQ